MKWTEKDKKNFKDALKFASFKDMLVLIYWEWFYKDRLKIVLYWLDAGVWIKPAMDKAREYKYNDN